MQEALALEFANDARLYVPLEQAYLVSRYVGGLQTSRSHKGDKDAKPPVALIDAKAAKGPVKGKRKAPARKKE